MVKKFEDLVNTFAPLMKKRFSDNEYKGDLVKFAGNCLNNNNYYRLYLLYELDRAVKELHGQVSGIRTDVLMLPEEQNKVQANCADIANYALLVGFAAEAMGVEFEVSEDPPQPPDVPVHPSRTKR